MILPFLSSSELKGTLSLPWSLTLTVPLSVAAQLSQILHQVLLSLLLIMAYCIGCLMDMDLRDCFPFCHFQAKSGKCDFLPSWRELEISRFFHENLYGFIRKAGNNVVSHFLESPLSVSINLPRVKSCLFLRSFGLCQASQGPLKIAAVKWQTFHFSLDLVGNLPIEST